MLSGLFEVLALVTWLYMLTFIARMVISWIQTFAPDWRAKGPVAVICEFLFTVTDPPLRAVGRVVRPVRIGPVALDLAFLIVVIALAVLQYVLTRLAVAFA